MKKWIKVTKATFHHAAGKSIFPPYLPLGNMWELELENGEVIDYPVRYKSKKCYRGWMHQRKSYDNDRRKTG